MHLCPYPYLTSKVYISTQDLQIGYTEAILLMIINESSMETIYCKKLQSNQPALPFAPLKGEIGIRIQHEISKPAWQQWLIKQTKLINEYKLDPLDPKAVQFLREEMEDYLFEDSET